MKRRKLIKSIEENGWWFDHEGTNHTIYTNGKQFEPIPRHPDVNEQTAKDIIKRTKKNPGSRK